MTVEEALSNAEIVADMCRQIPDEKPSLVEASMMTLADEVTRLRACVEAVRALPRFESREECERHLVETKDGDLLDRSDVLDALGVTDDGGSERP